ncbi:DUF4326 domain-containing protein [Acinetobacter proteolyticus]|uniref:DUF4326 domain-containing protein n=1 Tax=Acinetobacter proteolyticus TaxID=1776741 RepID=A0A2N0WK91_9GAMM|nr:DUF4326 domain-containing protein [Acinetobacter proteolyticus]PKF36864.1 hypothetical protein CW311_01885 [Acinetobacter proteolyticus]
MTNILIFLPNEFKCFTKFERKLLRITSSFESFVLSGPNDSNNFIASFASKNKSCREVQIENDWHKLEYTHAIIFDDGEVFPFETKLLKEQKIPLRIIKIKITRVINIHINTEFQELKKSDTYEYIGRGSNWGNPYSMFGNEQESREDVISKFKYDFDKDILMKAKKKDVHLLAGKRLGCFCKPHACHGDVIADYLNSLDDEL